MNSKDIFNGISDIRDDLIDGAMEAPKKQKRWRRTGWIGAVAAVLAIAVLMGVFLRPGGEMTFLAHAEAVYPDGSARFDYRNLGDTSNLQPFFADSARTFLSGADGENLVYSPLNVYMALSMLAQITGGESQEQILTLLGSESMDQLRQQAGDVWKSTYRNDEDVKTILANSLWLNENVEFKQDTLDILARDFYASSYQGAMGSAEFNQALQNWLNEQTGGLLEEQAKNVELDPMTILALASTVYFKTSWFDEFSESNTAPQTFHAPGGDQEIDFLHQSQSQDYYWGDNFSAVGQALHGGCGMWFLLPDEGVTPEELLSDSQALEFLTTGDRRDWENSKRLIVHKSIPKFDVDSQYDLIEGLESLGVTDVFDMTMSDFTPITTDVALPMYVSEINHAVRVTIDEDGCTAAAFTVIDVPFGAAPQPRYDEIDFVLDRPFIFCITGSNDLPLFIGIVNNPAE